MNAQDKKLAAAIDAAREEARATWPGAFVSVVSYGTTNNGFVGWSMRVDANPTNCPREDFVQVLYAGPTCSDPVNAINFGRGDSLYTELRARTLATKGALR